MLDARFLEIGDRSQIGEARRQAAQLAARAGLGEVPREELALVITELGTNLIKHAGGGDLIVRPLPRRPVVEVLAIDRGPGMDVARCVGDGYSTAGSAGTGLGAVKRLASCFDVYSMRPGGTVIVAHVGGEPFGVTPHGWEVGAVCLPMHGQEVCGDAWAAANGNRDSYAMMVADGLGHGLGAADAARAAERLFNAEPDLKPAALITSIHRGLRGTRGAAVAVARVDRRTSTLAFAGVGNISGAIVGPRGSRQLVSMNGTAGHEVQRINEFSYPWSDDALLVMHSDGLATRWDLSRYPGLSTRHPSVVAGVLVRDFSRGRDDVTVVAARATAT